MNEMLLIFLGVVSAEAGTDWALGLIAPESLRLAGITEFETSLLPHIAAIIVSWLILGFYVRFATPKKWRERYDKQRKMRFIRQAFGVFLGLDSAITSYLYFRPLIDDIPATQEPQTSIILLTLLIRGALDLAFFWSPILAIWAVVYRPRRFPTPRRRKTSRAIQKATDG